MNRLQRMWKLILDCQYHGRDVTYAFEKLSPLGVPESTIDGAVRAIKSSGRPLRETIDEIAEEIKERGIGIATRYES